MDVKRPSSAITRSSSRSSGLPSSRATSKYRTSSKKTQENIYSSPLSPSFTLSTSQPTVHILVTPASLLRSMNSEHITISDSLSSYSMHTSIQAAVSPNRSETAFGKTVDGDDIRPIGQLKNSRLHRQAYIRASLKRVRPRVTISHRVKQVTRQHFAHQKPL